MKPFDGLVAFVREEQDDAKRLAAMWGRDASTIVRCDGFTKADCALHADRHAERVKRFRQLEELLLTMQRPRGHEQD